MASVTEMVTADERKAKAEPFLAPLKAHPDWTKLMNKEIAQLVLDGKADAREAADFMLARMVRKIK